MTDKPVAPPVGAHLPRWGPHAEAPGMLALWQRHPAGEIEFVAPEHGLVIALSPIERRQTRLAGRNGPMHLAPVGSVNIVPAGADHWGCWGCDKESAVFATTPTRLAAAGAEHFERNAVELIASNTQRTDPVLLRLAHMLRGELRDGGLMTELYIDALGSLIMIHLLRHYSTLTRPAVVRHRRGGLTPRTQRAVLACMHDRVGERLSIAELAALAGLSSSAFLRAFREELGTTPHQHLLALRVSRARALLANTNAPIASIAVAAGFPAKVISPRRCVA